MHVRLARDLPVALLGLACAPAAWASYGNMRLDGITFFLAVMLLYLWGAPLALALGACVDVPKTNLADLKTCGLSMERGTRNAPAPYRLSSCGAWAQSNATAKANWSNTGQGASSLEPTGAP